MAQLKWIWALLWLSAPLSAMQTVETPAKEPAVAVTATPAKGQAARGARVVMRRVGKGARAAAGVPARARAGAARRLHGRTALCKTHSASGLMGAAAPR